MSEYKQTHDAAGKVTAQYGQTFENLNDDLVKRMNDVRDFPTNTCGSSRHAAMIAEALCKREEYPMLTEEPEHCGGSIAATVAALWECRADLRKMSRAQLAAEAKLARAVEALEKVQAFVRDLEPYADQGHTLVPALHDACMTLIELKGKADDRSE